MCICLKRSSISDGNHVMVVGILGSMREPRGGAFGCDLLNDFLSPSIYIECTLCMSANMADFHNWQADWSTGKISWTAQGISFLLSSSDLIINIVSPPALTPNEWRHVNIFFQPAYFSYLFYILILTAVEIEASRGVG